LVFSDCEGFEQELFCSKQIPALTACTAIIELHENAVPGITESIRANFANTHYLALTSTCERRVPPVDLDFLTDEERQLAINEVRGPGQWVLLTPKELTA
jgi:hypothetical protein